MALILVVGPLLAVIKSPHREGQDGERLSHSHLISQDPAPSLVGLYGGPGFDDLVLVPGTWLVRCRPE